MVFDAKILDDIAKRLGDVVPTGVTELQANVAEKIRSVLQASFAKLDLVTREEFDIQTKVLARTRAKVDDMERQVAELERKMLASGSPDKS